MPKHEIEVMDADEQKITDQSTSLLDPKIAAYFAIITDGRHLAQCAESIRAINGARKFIKTVWDHACSEANKLHKSFTSRRNRLDSPLEEAKRTRTAACGKYVDAKAAAARLERDKIEEAARKEAEAAKAEQVVALREAGEGFAAQAVAEAPIVTHVPAAAPLPKPVGVVLTKHWKFEVMDSFKVPRYYLTPNMAAIGKFAREHKAAAVMAGVRFFSV